MKPSIVHVVQHLKPGGIESFALEFQRAAKPFFDVHIISLENQNIQGYWSNAEDYEDFIHLLNKKPGWQMNIYQQLKAIFEQIRPIYVHTHHIGPLVYGGIAARLANITHIVHTEHDAWHLENLKARLLQKLILNLVRPIYVADANFVAHQIKHLMPSHQPIVIPNGIDTEKFKPSLMDKAQLLEKSSLPTDLTYIGCAARLESIKGHDVLIKALAKLPSNIGLLLAGTGSLQVQLKRLVYDLHLESRVFFLGHIEDMTSFYPLIDIFCLSSNNEGLPLSPLEAQACSIPAVLTDVGGCKEAVCQQTGAIVQANNPDLLSQALLSVLKENNPNSPRSFITQQRSIKKMISQYISLIHSELRYKLC